MQPWFEGPGGTNPDGGGPMAVLRERLAGLGEHLAALAFPRHCVACQRLLGPQANWCPPCWNELVITRQRPYCPTCGRPLGPHQRITRKKRCAGCENEPWVLAGLCLVGTYEPLLSEAIRNYKYNKHLHAGQVLAELLAGHLADRLWIEEVDVLVPVASHWSRIWRRGFDHTRLLVEHLARRTGIPVLRVLERTRATAPQVNLSATSRAENISGAFRTKSHMPLDGAVVCLVDDVMTLQGLKPLPFRLTLVVAA